MAKIDVIPHGTFSIYKKFQSQKFTELSSFTFLWFGRIWEYKGLDLFIIAANRLVRMGYDFHFIIAGIGEDSTKYFNDIEDVSKFTIRNERVPLDEAGAYFEYSNVVVLPYKDASQSGIIPVAFAYGKPVICTRVGSLDEVVKNQVNGIVIEKGDIEGLVEAMIELYCNSELYSRLSEGALKTSEIDLSWDRVANLTENVYLKALSEN